MCVKAYFVFYWENPFSVGLVGQLFQLASNQVEKVEKALAVFFRGLFPGVTEFQPKYSIEKRQTDQVKLWLGLIAVEHDQSVLK